MYNGLIYGALIGALIGFTLLLITTIGKPSCDTFWLSFAASICRL